MLAALGRASERGTARAREFSHDRVHAVWRVEPAHQQVLPVLRQSARRGSPAARIRRSPARSCARGSAAGTPRVGCATPTGPRTPTVRAAARAALASSAATRPGLWRTGPAASPRSLGCSPARSRRVCARTRSLRLTGRDEPLRRYRRPGLRGRSATARLWRATASRPSGRLWSSASWLSRAAPGRLCATGICGPRGTAAVGAARSAAARRSSAAPELAQWRSLTRSVCVRRDFAAAHDRRTRSADPAQQPSARWRWRESFGAAHGRCRSLRSTARPGS
jgi:hypothetical protein